MNPPTYAEAISRAIVRAMEDDPKIVLLGSGAPDRTGVFGTTLEATRRFPERVFDVPNSEAALGGIVCGLASQGYRPLHHHHRIDFATYCFDPIVNLLAKFSAMYQTDPLPVTIRAIVGRGWGQGPTHSQFLGSTFAHFPGLTVVAPYNATSAAVELDIALHAPGPTLVIEHRALYPHRELPGWDQEWQGATPLVTVATTSLGVREAYIAATRLWDTYKIGVDVVAVYSLRPLVLGAVFNSLNVTNRLVVLDPGWTEYGFGAEILASVAEVGCLLDVSPVRLAPPAVPAPISAPLEQAYWPGAEAVVRAVLQMLGREEAPSRPEGPGTFTGPY